MENFGAFFFCERRRTQKNSSSSQIHINKEDSFLFFSASCTYINSFRHASKSTTTFTDQKKDDDFGFAPLSRRYVLPSGELPEPGEEEEEEEEFFFLTIIVCAMTRE